MADFPNRNKQRVRQNEETEEYVLNERIRQNLEKELNEVEMSNMPDIEFKVMVIKSLPGLEKREEDLQQRNSKYKKEPTRDEELNN